MRIRYQIIEIEGILILEVGSCIGLASLALNHRLARSITSIDYHAAAEAFLQENKKLNNGPVIPFIRTAWGDRNTSVGTFDLIIGSDLFCERDHSAESSKLLTNTQKHIVM